MPKSGHPQPDVIASLHYQTKQTMNAKKITPLKPKPENDLRDYVEAAWCFMNTMLDLQNFKTVGDARESLQALEIYFSKENNLSAALKLLCEKAAIIAVYGPQLGATGKKIWASLLNKKTGFGDLGLTGQKVHAFKQKNPQMMQPIHITVDHLLLMFRSPGDKTFESCSSKLTDAGYSNWMPIYIDALRFKPQIEY